MSSTTKELDVDEELRAIKEDIALEFAGNVNAMALDLRRRELESGREVVSFDPALPKAP